MPRRRNADRTPKKKGAPAPAPAPEPEPEPRARRRDPQPVDESTEIVAADDVSAKLNDSLAASDAAAGADAQSPMVFTDHVADRECQDSLCCVVLLAYVAALALIGMVAEEQGDLNRLLHPMDYKGWTCGTSENWDASGEWTEDGEPGWASTVDSRPYGYYPRLAEDVMYFAGDGGNECMSSMGDNGGVPGSECKLNLYTICVESCPQAGDIVCTYEKERQLELLPTAQERTTARQVLATEREHCWWVPVDMSKYADRCIAFPPHVETTTTTYCDTFDEHGETIRAVIQPSEHTQCAGDIRTETNTVTETTGGSQTEFAALLVLSETMNMVTDVATCWPVILMIGGLVSVLASFSLLWLLRILAKPLVWLVIIVLWFVLLVAMMIAFVKNGDFFGIDVSADAISNAMEERLDVGLSDSQAELMSGYLNEDESSILWLPLSYGLLAMCVTYILVLMASKKKVDLAIGLISVASKVVLTMPALAIYPFITWGLLFVALVYGLTVGALIDSADMRPADLGSAMTRMHHEVGCQFRPDAAARLECLEEHARNLSHVRCWNCSVDGTAPPLEYTADGSSDDWEVDAVMAFHFFGIIWIVHFIKDFCTIAMANAAAQGYWAEDLDGDGVIDIDPHAVLEGFKRTLHYSSGSAALGSFILAIVTCIRAICAYLSKQAQALDETSTTMKYVVKLVNCAMWCFEKVIRFMTRAAYIIVAIEGKSFCGAAWRSFKMVLGHPAKIGFVQSIAWSTILVMKLAIAAVCTLLFVFIANTSSEFRCPQQNEAAGCPEAGAYPIDDATPPTICVFLLSFVVGTAFMEVYSVTIDTMLFSFISEEGQRKEGEPSHASHWGLDEFMSADDVKEKSDGEKAADEEALSKKGPPEHLTGEGGLTFAAAKKMRDERRGGHRQVPASDDEAVVEP